MLRTIRVIGIFVAVWLTVTAWSSSVEAQAVANVFPPEWVTRMNIPRTDVPPAIDGRINAQEWRESVRLMGAADDAHAADFAGVDLAFYAAWDSEHLYLAGHAPMPPNKRLVRQRRERYTSEVIWDDAFEFGISLLGRNRAVGEVDSFYKFTINSLGAGEYIRMYPQIGQYLYNWRPQMKIANGVHDIDGQRVWQIEIAVPLDDLSMPREHRAGDPIRLLFNQTMKLGSHFGWNPIPTASGFLVDAQWPTGLLTDDQPFARIERLSGLHQDRVELTVALVNPTDQPVTVEAHVLVRNEGQDPAQPELTIPDHLALDHRELIRIPAGEEVLFKLDRDLEDMTYTYGEYERQYGGRRGFFQMAFTAPGAAAEHPIYDFATVFKRKDGPNVFTAPMPLAASEAFPLSVRFNPVRNNLFLSADTLDAPKLEGREAAAMTFEVRGEDRVVHTGRIDRFVHFKFEGLAELPELEPGRYRVVASLIDASGTVLLEHEGVDIEKKNEAEEFHHWWGNRIGHAERLLKPFEPVSVKRAADTTDIDVTRRRYRLDGLGLPAAIESNGGPVMTGPVRIVAVIGGTEHVIVPAGPLEMVSTQAWEARFKGRGGAAGLEVAVNGRIEQDGLTDLSITISPASDPVEVEELRIEWPLNDTLGNWISCIGVGGNYSARFINRAPAGEGRVWNTLDHIGNAGSGMTVGNFYGNLWVGNEQRGLLWSADTDQGWVPRDDAPAHSLTRRGDTLVMTNHLISPPGDGDPPFHLEIARTVHVQYMASPFRHLARGWRLNQGSAAAGFTESPKYKWDWDSGVEHFSILSPPFADRDRWPEYFAHTRAVAQERAHGGLTGVRPRYHGYLTNQIALRGYMTKTREAGVYDYFAAEWMFGGNETLNDTYIDYMMYLVDRHIREGGLAHIYFDIAMTMVSDALSAGFGYLLPDGRIQPTSMDGTLREWYKRNWALMQDHGLYPGGVSGHATNAIVIKSLPFTDAVVDSEFSMPDPIDAYPMDRMIALSVPHTFGTMIDHVGFMSPHWANLHDSKLKDGSAFTSRENGSLFWTPPIRMFGITREDVRFIPYWRNSDVVRQVSDGVLASMWARPGAVLIALLHYDDGDSADSEKPRPIRMELDLVQLGVPAGIDSTRLRIREMVIEKNHVSSRWGVGRHEWFQTLPLIDGDAAGEQIRQRPGIHPRLDADTGVLDGFEMFYRDFRYLQLTWDGHDADPATLARFPEPLHEEVMAWGLFHADTRALSAGEMGQTVQSDRPDVEVSAWHRGDGVLLLLKHNGAEATEATLQFDLGALNLQISKLWEQFYLPYDMVRERMDTAGFDGWAQTWKVQLEPHESRVLTLVRN